MYYLNAYEYWAMDRERVRQVLAGDLLLYEDAEGRLRHAAYAVDGDLVLNKNGEVKFHPVKLLKVEKLAREWPGNTLSYRAVRAKSVQGRRALIWARSTLAASMARAIRRAMQVNSTSGVQPKCINVARNDEGQPSTARGMPTIGLKVSGLPAIARAA